MFKITISMFWDQFSFLWEDNPLDSEEGRKHAVDIAFPVGNLEKSCIAPGSIPGVLADPAAFRLRISNYQDAVTAYFLTGNMLVNPTAIREEIIVNVHASHQRTVMSQVIFAEDVKDIPARGLIFENMLGPIRSEDALGSTVGKCCVVREMGFVTHSPAFHGLERGRWEPAVAACSVAGAEMQVGF